MQWAKVKTSLTLITVVFCASQASAIETVTLAFEIEAFDLDAGVIHAINTGMFDPASEADVSITYNADRSPHSVFVPVAAGTEIAVVEAITCDAVTAADVASLAFAPKPSDVPIGSSHCLLIRTNQGAVFKLGNVIEDNDAVTFDYTAL